MSVYFVASADMQRIKIGKATDMKTRWNGLCRMNPYPLLLVGEIAGGGYVERALHKRFAADRLHGEWFRTSPELEDLIREVQTVGLKWSVIHLPLCLKADGYNSDMRALVGRGRYVAQDQLNRIWATNSNEPAATPKKRIPQEGNS